MLTLISITVLLILVIVSLKTFYNISNYWKKKGVTSVNSFGFGWFSENVFRTNSNAIFLKFVYDNHPDKRYLGFYNFFRPVLLIRDPQLIKAITVKGFDSFNEHNSILPLNVDHLWAKNLFSVLSDDWYRTRRAVSPLFTGSKLRKILPILQHCTTQFINELHKEIKEGKTTININDAFTRVSSDMIGSVAFGVTTNSMKDKYNEVYVRAQEGTSLSGFTGLTHICYSLCPALIKILNIKVYSERVSQFFESLIKESIKLRMETRTVRHDLIQLLRNTVSAESQEIVQKREKLEGATEFKSLINFQLKMTEDELIANVLLFYFAAFQTTSSALSFVSYELTIHSDVQQKLYDEIQKMLIKCDGAVTYDVLTEMKYLDNVIFEVLRLHPPTALIDRQCVKPYIIEPTMPGEKPLYLEKNTWVWILQRAIQYDKKYYPNPEEFNPDRFNDENKHRIKPFTFIPFGSGPRNCIGSRLALLEMKLTLVELLRNYELVEVQKTRLHKNFNSSEVYPVNKNGIWIGLSPRNDNTI